MKRFWAVPLATVLACCVGLGVVSAAEVEPTPQFDPPVVEETPTAPQTYYPSTPAPSYNPPAHKPKPKKKPLKTKRGLLIASEPALARALLTNRDFTHAMQVGTRYGINAATSPVMLIRVPINLLNDPKALKNNPEFIKALVAGVGPRAVGAAAGGAMGAGAGFIVAVPVAIIAAALGVGAGALLMGGLGVVVGGTAGAIGGAAVGAVALGVAGAAAGTVGGAALGLAVGSAAALWIAAGGVSASAITTIFSGGVLAAVSAVELAVTGTIGVGTLFGLVLLGAAAGFALGGGAGVGVGAVGGGALGGAAGVVLLGGAGAAVGGLAGGVLGGIALGGGSLIGITTAGALLGATAGVVATTVATGVIAGTTAGVIDLDNSLRKKSGYRQIDADKKLLKFSSAKDTVETSVKDIEYVVNKKPKSKNNLVKRIKKRKDILNQFNVKKNFGKLDLGEIAQI